MLGNLSKCLDRRLLKGSLTLTSERFSSIILRYDKRSKGDLINDRFYERRNAVN